jgi:prepilin-type N-terminal cleavage/methylation domain-containing protein
MNTPSSFSKQRERGFTLVEVIVTLVVAAILGAFLVSFMGTALTKSGEPVVRAKQLYELQQVMENIKATYLSMADATDALTRLNAFITTSPVSSSYTIVTKSISFTQDVGGNYTENSTVCPNLGSSGSNCALKVTISSSAAQGLSLTEVFTQRP